MRIWKNINLCIWGLFLCGCAYTQSPGQQLHKPETTFYTPILDTLQGSSAIDSIKATINRFQHQIDAFAIQDKKDGLPNSQNLIIEFVGSSSIRGWYTIKNDLGAPHYEIIRRGFGGSTMQELIYYFDELVYKYKPETLFVYEGENAMTLSYSVADDALISFIAMSELIHKKLPNTHVVFLSMKPTPYSWHQWLKIKRANQMIKKYIQKLPKTYNFHYLDVATAMLTKSGTPIPDIYRSDGIHLNANGYAIWRRIILQYLRQENHK